MNNITGVNVLILCAFEIDCNVHVHVYIYVFYLKHLFLQDSEIARLRTKISGLERTIASLNMSLNNNSDSVYHSSMIGGAEVVKRRHGSENTSEADSQESRSAPVSPAARRKILREPYSTAGKLHGEFQEPEDETALYMLPVPKDSKSMESKRTQQVHFKDGDVDDEFDEVIKEEEDKLRKSHFGMNNGLNKSPLKSKGVPRLSKKMNSKDSQNLAAQRGRGRKSDHLPGEFEIGKFMKCKLWLVMTALSLTSSNIWSSPFHKEILHVVHVIRK